ncbi:MAG: hypothetical protein QM753_17065 [Thermomicrobiales bacterium]
MIAVADLIPTDPDEQRTVRSVLDAHPELRGFIARASAKAEALFPGATIRLDSVQYDEWDPPLQLTVLARLPLPEFSQRTDMLMSWVRSRPDNRPDLLAIFPQWAGEPRGTS